MDAAAASRQADKFFFLHPVSFQFDSHFIFFFVTLFASHCSFFSLRKASRTLRLYPSHFVAALSYFFDYFTLPLNF